MAFTGIMTTEAEIDSKSGAGVSVSVTDVMKTAWCLGAENTVNAAARFNFSDVWAATLDVDIKYILSDIVSSIVAIYCINYDFSGYNTRQEAESMINVLRDSVMRGLSLIRSQAQKDFINGA